ncbi:predicted protein [Naegleria gruberi]|uniref:Predicted protein n=1 Tax=Naegleria gruberi TaxID=5762 RepID=D2W3Z8_NAEGR|nr:uncharacterized protein NAEGRDRAFT_60050 [Naegleria gruberi]EFC36205.1 predicted protein [Naegleria gruberi]|eukprot:XP_002668949.1 predicted protein [Naegleria gruberi strain NEG-M]
MSTSASSSTVQQVVRKSFQFEVLGFLESVFKQKTGCPRQSLIVPKARGRLLLKFGGFTSNTQHFVEGLEGFSHIWLFWVFHQNNNLAAPNDENDNAASSGTELTKFQMMQKAKVRPPRMNGKKIGSLSCRAPYRPNPLGMSVVKLDRIERDENNNAILHLSGIDLVDGTPIVDIKPYIPEYDMVMEQPLSLPLLKEIVKKYFEENSENSTKKRKTDEETSSSIPSASTVELDDSTDSNLFAKVADWMENMPRKQQEITQVKFTERSLEMIETLLKKSTFYKTVDEVKSLFEDLIKLDPRSKYRREKCQEELFGIHVDVFNILCRVNENVCTIEEIEDWSNGSPYTKEELKERTKRHRNAMKEAKLKQQESSTEQPSKDE